MFSSPEAAVLGRPRSEHGEVAQQRDDADDDDDDLDDVLDLAVERQHPHEIEHEADDQDGDQQGNQHRHDVNLWYRPKAGPPEPMPRRIRRHPHPLTERRGAGLGSGEVGFAEEGRG